MDEALHRFREAAAQENRGRRHVRRRYSKALQQQAVGYWRIRRRSGVGLQEVAAALGVAPWTLRRWQQSVKSSARFRPVQIVAPEPTPAPRELAIVWSASGPRVEGLDVGRAARLLVLLR